MLRLLVSSDEVFECYCDPVRRETMRKTMVAEGFLFDLPLHALSDQDQSEIDGRLLLADVASTEGTTIPLMIDDWERELATAQAFDTVEEVMAWLHEHPASRRAK